MTVKKAAQTETAPFVQIRKASSPKILTCHSLSSRNVASESRICPMPKITTNTTIKMTLP